MRAASSHADPNAEASDPPAARTPTAANWLAPVNTSSDMAHACPRLRPAAVASTPNDIPNAPIGTPSAQASRRTPASERASGEAIDPSLPDPVRPAPPGFWTPTLSDSAQRHSGTGSLPETPAGPAPAAVQ